MIGFWAYLALWAIIALWVWAIIVAIFKALWYVFGDTHGRHMGRR